MKHSKSYERDWGLIEGINRRQIDSCDLLKQTIQTKIDEGHKIIFAANGRWCEIDGETYNVSKALFDKWVNNHEIELPMNYIS